MKKAKRCRVGKIKLVRIEDRSGWRVTTTWNPSACTDRRITRWKRSYQIGPDHKTKRAAVAEKRALKERSGK